jgi:uncharacterized protein
MSAVLSAGGAIAAPAASRVESATTAAAIREACARIAPLWPLTNFVAVNPFLGVSGRSFEDSCALFRRVTGAQMLMPTAFYREALAAGMLTDADLGRGLAEAPRDWPLPADVAELRARLADGPADDDAPPPAPVATVADVLDSVAHGNRQVSRTAFMIDEIARFCAAYFDQGQSVWRLPWRDQPPYAAWREAMRHDRNPEAMGITGFRAAVAGLPAEPQQAIAVVLAELGIPAAVQVDYLHRALFDIRGWAGYARQIGWFAGLHDRPDDTLVQLLAIRIAWGYAVFRSRSDDAFRDAWRKAMAVAASPAAARPVDAGLALRLVLQLAYESASRRRFVARLDAGRRFRGPTPLERPAVQATFCIDVRSEVFRRALESVYPEARTAGFAGFFGFPIEYVPIGSTRGSAQCPVLLKPRYVVCEAVSGAGEDDEQEILGWRLLRRRAARAWKSFKLSAISSFTFVEAAGLLFAAKLVGDSFGLTRPVSDPHVDGLNEEAVAAIGPRIEPRIVGKRHTGFDAEDRAAMAEAVLRGLSLTRAFARLVLLVGHGSTTVNNPQASGLDCGACGGHTGEANARVAASVLNDPDVRIALRRRGILVPDDTWFLAALHDTTTDDVRLFDTAQVPPMLADDVDRLRDRLEQAGVIARLGRAALLGIDADADVDAEVRARSRDWSQVRPEWGLAGNRAFIAAPRSRTVLADLQGRAFLHEYDWRADRDFQTLTLIMTAPMVVASWINLQYYGSTVDNDAFGAGNKVLHNVTGLLGVIEGNAGDLKTGLPWQSLHDGERFVHEPLRLDVYLAAPLEAIDAVIAANETVRELVENRWLHLFALADDGRVSHRRVGGRRWEPLA